MVDGETLAGWDVISRSPHGRIDIMFGPVVTTEAHLAFSRARTRLKHCLFLVLMAQWPGMNNRVSIIILNTLFGVCLGHDRSPHTCTSGASMSAICMVSVQHRLRVTMQHVFGRGGNLGNECADHAAALGTFRFTSSHNVATR